MNIVQQDMFENLSSNDEITDKELLGFTKFSKQRSSNIGGAIGRLIRAKRYHEVANRLSEELLNMRIENEKLREKLKLMQGAS